jgi:hypothetical protein
VRSGEGLENGESGAGKKTMSRLMTKKDGDCCPDYYCCCDGGRATATKLDGSMVLLGRGYLGGGSRFVRESGRGLGRGLGGWGGSRGLLCCCCCC